MAETSKHIFASGAETTTIVEWSGVQTNATNSSTNPKAGSRSFKLDYNLNSGDIVSQLQRASLPTFKNWSIKFDFRFETAPSSDSTIFSIGTGDDDVTPTSMIKLSLSTARKLILQTNDSGWGTTTGATVLNTATYYQIELRGDITGDGIIYLRIDEVDELNRNQSSTSDTRFNLGENDKGTPSDPAFIAYVDDIVFWHSDSGSDDTPPWLNTQKTHYRTVGSAGTNNNYSGSYTNVDDYTSDAGTDYNQGGAPDASGIQKQDFSVTSATFLGGETFNGITVFGRFITKLLTDSTNTASKLAVISSSIEYTTALEDNASKRTAFDGWQGLPDGTALSEANADAIDIGSNITKTNLSTTDITNTTPVEYFNSDGVNDDGDYTQVGGTGTDAHTVMGDNSGATYITHNGANDRQSFAISAISTTLTNVDIVGVSVFGQHSAGSNDGTWKLYFRETDGEGGTYHYGDLKTMNSVTFPNVRYRFGDNPYDNSDWTSSAITGHDWGYEIITPATTAKQFTEAHLELWLVSDVREHYYWMVSVYGDAFTEFEPEESDFLPRLNLLGTG